MCIDFQQHRWGGGHGLSFPTVSARGHICVSTYILHTWPTRADPEKTTPAAAGRPWNGSRRLLYPLPRGQSESSFPLFLETGSGIAG